MSQTVGARLHTLAAHRLQRLTWASGWLLGCLLCWAGASAGAADMSAASASALKVLSAPYVEAPGNSEASSAKSSASPQGSGSGAGAGPSAATATTATTTAPSITVQKGESIDAVLRRGLPGLPLKEELLRQALVKANPKIFSRGRTFPVRPGTVLALPTTEALRQLFAAHSPQAEALLQGAATDAQGTENAPGPEKRRWVRFP